MIKTYQKIQEQFLIFQIFSNFFDIFNNLDRSFRLHQIHLSSFGESNFQESLESKSRVYVLLNQLEKLIL